MSNRFAFFDGRIVPIDEAKVSIMTSALNYGTAIFEGIRGYWNDAEQCMVVFALREHLERFLRNCRILLIDPPHDVETLERSVVDLLQLERFETDTYIRPLAFKSSAQVGVRLHDLDASCSIFAVPFGRYVNRPGGITVMVSSWRRVADNAIPPRGKIAGAYVNSALAKTEAVLNGYDEAIVLNGSGRVSEGSAANVFLVREGCLITPPVTEGILEGIVRSSVFRFAVDLGIPFAERPIDRSELYVADEVFLTGTGIELTPVIEIDHRPIGARRPGPLFSRLVALFDDVVHGRSDIEEPRCTRISYDAL